MNKEVDLLSINNSTQPFSEVGGHHQIIMDLRYKVELPQLFPDEIKMQKSGILLCGPPGCGKTLIARQLSASLGDCHFQVISGPELMSKYVGEAEQRLREIFGVAYEEALIRKLPSFIFIDEIDSVIGSRDNSDNNYEVRFVDQFLTLMDGFNDRGNIIVIGATNRVHAIDIAARRPGRFEEEIQIGFPTPDELVDIFMIFIEKYRKFVSVSQSLSKEYISTKCCSQLDGYNGSDVEGIFKRAYENSKKRCFSIVEGKFKQLNKLSLEESDLLDAIKNYIPILKRTQTEITNSK